MDFSTLVTSIATGFTKLVRAFARNPFSFISTTLLVIIVLGLGGTAYMVATNQIDVTKFINHTQPAPIVEAQRLQDSIPRDAMTCTAIDELGKTLHADRATYWHFSNATYGLNTTSYNFSNLTCPYVDPGVAFIPEDFEKVNNTVFAQIHAVLFPSRNEVACAKFTIDDIKSTYVRASMRSVGTDVVYDCGVQDLRGIPIGKIVVSWRNRNAVGGDDAAILASIKEAASDIGRFNTPDPSTPAQ